MKPRLPEVVQAMNAAMGIEGILFVGDQWAIMAGFNGQSPQLFQKGQPASIVLLPEFTGPIVLRGDASSQGSGRRQKTRGERSSPWVRACKGGEPSPGNFLNAASITDTVNLGTVALRAGRKVTFDSENTRITDPAGANRYLVREYRKGWEL
jgi:hypothetical protein